MPKTTRLLVLVAAPWALAACSSSDPIRCATSADCLQGGITGECLDSPESSEKWCAFSDPHCEGSMLRWGRLSGDGLGGECVAAGASVNVKVTLTGSGAGSVTSDPAGIDCGTVCEAEFPASNSVALRALPDSHSYFMGFGGDCTGRDTCTPSGASAAVSARFEPHGKSLWSGRFGDTFYDYGNAVASDPAGPVYVGGTVGAFKENYVGQLVVLRLDPATGAPVWTKFFGAQGTAAGEVSALAVDPRNGDVIAAGWFGGTLDLDGHVVETNDTEIFVARLSAQDGTGLGVFKVPATQPTLFEPRYFGMAIDSYGDIVIAAHTRDGFAWGGDTVNGAAAVDAVLVKASPSGAPLFARGFGAAGSGINMANAVAVDALGDIYVAGEFDGTVTFAAGVTRSAVGDHDVFLSRWSGAGDHVWTKTFGSNGRDVAEGLVARAGALQLAGEFAGQINLGGIDLFSNGGTTDTFIAAFSSAGSHRWSRKLDGLGTETVRKLCSGDDGQLVLGVAFSSGLVVDGDALGGQGAGLVDLDPADGHARWTKKLGLRVLGAVGCGADQLVVVGAFENSVMLDDHTLSSAGQTDAAWQALVP